MDEFEVAALVFGALLIVGALASGLARRSFLSMTAVFVVAGFALGEGGVGVLEFDAESGFVAQLATVALIVILFRDGIEVEAEMLQREWRLPARKLVLAMPITCVLVALAARVLTDLSWTECFLLGALLSPTDPVLSSSVVTNPRVPRLVRHSLNLESGMNDGLALPAVLAFSAALAAGEDDFVWYEFVLQDVTLGLAFGVGLGFLASWLMPRRAEGIPDHVCAITLGIRRPDLGRRFEERADDIVEIVKLGIFVVFGALLTVGGLFGDGWAAVAIAVFTLVFARTIAIWISLAGAGIDTATKGFMAWFGPKGVATMTFSILVLGQPIAEGERIFNLAALVVFCSIVVHGLSDTPGSEWLATRRGEPGTSA